MSHQLPNLGFAFDALEPHIDAKTMEIHHGKHHAAYVSKLNAALEGQGAFADKPVNELIADLKVLPENIRGAVGNNGGGHSNHTLFWEILAPGGANQPGGSLADAINASFNSFEAFKEEFSNAAATRFGSGWAWLALDADGKLLVCSTPNQDSPLMEGKTPLCGLDVWEHAYYLNYQNRRPDYIAAFWKIVNWDVVSEKYNASKS